MKLLTQILQQSANNVVPQTWRNSATVLMVFEDKNSSRRQEFQSRIKFLVTKRSGSSSFYPNAICFPGGAVSPEDKSIEWRCLFEKAGIDLNSLQFLKEGAINPPLYATSYDPNEIPSFVSLRLTAIRETFEECGILLCRKFSNIGKLETVKSTYTIFPSETELRTWQKRVKNDPKDFLKLCNELKVCPNLINLFEWNNWLTPTVFPMRYRFDTIFYITFLHDVPPICIDPDEVSEYHIADAESLTAKPNKLGKLPPPQTYELTRLKTVLSSSELFKLALIRQELGMRRWCPVVIKTRDGGMTLLPGDDLFPESQSLFTQKSDDYIDSTYSELISKTKNHHRIHSYDQIRDPEIIVNIQPGFGQVYPSTI